MSRDDRAPLRVGLLVLTALTLAGVAVFLLGDRQNLFRAKSHYHVRLATANGLQVGAAVQLNGVDVGQVVDILLPEDMGETQLRIRMAVDSRYEQRIRADSQARIKTLGLLGDKFVEITSGSPSAAVVPEEGEIPSAPTTNVDQLVASGEDMMANLITISSQLAAILSRMERGEGLLGELTKDVEPGKKMTVEFYATLESLRKAAEKIEGGKGPVPRLLGDEALGDKLASSVDRLDSILAKAESGDGVVASLLSDAEQKQKLARAFDSLERAAAAVSKIADRLEESEALLPK
ncbi:MAG: MlaD family protein, partial [Thermoanaerobaculia bacterium]|nr:MlaD family protein [Thermoanaerobaculia bacterium]